MPVLAISESKRKYNASDMLEWVDWRKIPFTFNSVFPLRTVLPLRVNIIEGRTFHLLFKAAWVQNINIGDPAILLNLLNSNGFDGEKLLLKAEEKWVKEKLKENTERAKNSGLCGVPSFIVNDRELIWGQDKINIVEDLLCGWKGQREIQAKF